MNTKEDFPDIQEFIESSQTVFIPAICAGLTGSSEANIVLSKSKFPIEKFWKKIENNMMDITENTNNKNYIHISEFFEKVAEKWRNEKNYQMNILNTKDNIYKYGSSLINEIESEDLKKIVQEEIPEIIDQFFRLINFDEKFEAEKFCKDLQNGFHQEAFSRLEKMLSYVFHNPLPENYYDDITKMILENLKRLNPQNNEIEMKAIFKNIRDKLKVKSIQTSEFKTSEELNQKLNKICTKNQLCKILAENFNKHTKTIKEFSRCINSIEIKTELDSFATIDADFGYQSLEFEDWLNKENCQQIFDNILKPVQGLSLLCNVELEGTTVAFGENILKFPLLKKLKVKFIIQSTYMNLEMEKFLKQLLHAKTLNYLHIAIRESYISLDVLNNIVSIAKEKQFSTLKLDFSSCEFEEKSHEFFKEVEKLDNLSVFSLNMNSTKHGFEDKNISCLAESLKNLTRLKKLNLNFSCGTHKIGQFSMKKLGESLEKLENLVSLKLKFQYGKNYIEDAGLIEVSKGLNYLKSLTKLCLVFSNNGFSDKGVKVFSNSLGNLKKIFNLKINFSRNTITNEGMKTIASALSDLKLIEKLDFNFSMSKINDDAIKELSEKIYQLEFLRCLKLDFSTNKIKQGDESVNCFLSFYQKSKKLKQMKIDISGHYISQELKDKVGEKNVNKKIQICLQE